VLVTGAIRSGTTWVGGMLALAPGTEIVHEPFNQGTGPGVFGVNLRFPLEYVCEENEQPYLAALERTLAFRYGYRRQLAVVRSRADLVVSARDARRFAAARRSAARPIVKDALAVLSAEWIAARFDAQVVMLVRHPAAFVSSILRLEWDLGFPWVFLEQPLLRRDRLAAYEADIHALAARPSTLLEQAILFWRVVYGTLHEQSRWHPEWLIRRHEDLAADPDAAFRELYATLDLEYTEAVRQQILAHSAPGNPVEWSSPHDVRLDSRGGLGRWKHRLSDEQIVKIRDASEDVWRHYYSAADWGAYGRGEGVERAS
jgi:hypothetical protein